VRVWIDNQLILNQWDSLDSLSPAGTFSFSTREVPYGPETETRDLSSVLPFPTREASHSKPYTPNPKP